MFIRIYTVTVTDCPIRLCFNVGAVMQKTLINLNFYKVSNLFSSLCFGETFMLLSSSTVLYFSFYFFIYFINW